MADAVMTSSLLSHRIFNNGSDQTIQNSDTSGENSAVSSGDEMMTCTHCDYVSNSSSEMTRHRWDVHPLLTRRKQHLMRSQGRKRPNSESAEEPKISDDICDVMAKKRSSSDDVAKETSGRSSDLAVREPPAQIRRVNSAEMGERTHVKAIVECHRKTNSLGDASAFKRENEKRNKARSASLSLINGIAAAPLADMCSEQTADCIKARVLNPTGPLASPAVTTQPGLNTLAKAAVTVSSQGHPVAMDTSVAETREAKQPRMISPPPAAWSNLIPAASGSLNDMLAEGQKMSHGYTLSPAGAPICPGNVSPIPNMGTMIAQHPLQAFLPQAAFYNQYALEKGLPLAAGGVFLHNPYVSGLLPNPMFPMPTSFYPGLSFPVPENTKPQPYDAEGSRHLNLTTLSDVATRILSVETQNGKERSQSPPKRSLEAVSSPPTSCAPSKRRSVAEFLPSSPATPSSGTQIKSSKADQKALTSKPSPPTQRKQQQLNNKFSQLESRPAAKVISQRQPAVTQSMDGDRLRSLEQAIRDTDCCDPNERSNVLPFCCPDGKWRMVRSKRIGGAWLVQMPGSDTPTLYVPKQSEPANTDTLNEWLKSKLTVTGEPSARNPHTKKTPGVNMANGRQACQRQVRETKALGRYAKDQKRGMKDMVSSDAIRNLLLQKTALA
ncbi:unnamed protein product [Clavelina lepadiformis]|uniref:Zinc finger protein n=1 Tax=Clavelina lepadiformis TaxID=159417 RepID=A0ABP0F290_CLALP